jgi:hypothetical protein
MVGDLRAGGGQLAGGSFWVAAFPSVRDQGYWIPAFQRTAITGLVYDASIGRSAPIPGAHIDYAYHSPWSGERTGSLTTGADGTYRLEVQLAPDDTIDLSTTVAGFAGAAAYLGANWYTGEPTDFGLPPIGGLIRIDPATATVQCAGSIAVTITNVGPPGETLVVIGIALAHGYSQGEYGRGFSWDLSQIHLPAFLASGESLTFPVSFASAPGDLPSRLYVNVVSGAENSAMAVYHGRVDGCATPTPTTTPAG